jgi:GalNAc-alpha-(1->4)-GalNAc-alpha-(1->3)-diNAcBac-PP-undecaprenol alpha-1,4-N-acetyl-D-galactosaminyltransferase
VVGKIAMKIMLTIFSMTAGGAERVAATLANHWVGVGDELVLVTVASSSTDFYELDRRIERVALDLNRSSRSWRESLSNNFHIVRALRATIRSFKPDVVLSFVDIVNIRVLIAALGTGVPVIVEEHIDPTTYSIGKLAGILRRLLYRRARTVVVLTDRIARWASRIVARKAIRVIPNPISDQFCNRHEPRTHTVGHKLIAMGRMESQKGFDMLLRAFAQCADDHPDWTLSIIGQGSERERLSAQANEIGIAHRVKLEGVVKQPEKMLQQADLFVLPSRFEGFPMALLEAMACGLAVVSFDCHSGPREIIRDGVDGILVPRDNVDALAKAMSRLMGAESERKRLGECAVDVVERFSLIKIAQMWRSILDQAVSVTANQ